MNTRGHRAERVGVVVSNKMDKTLIVRVDRKMPHPRYGKVIVRGKKYYAHHEGDTLELGQTVRIMETRPLSKTKRWRVVEVLNKDSQ